MNRTQSWYGSETSKVLIIGHDPRLQTSQTEAEFCFFANYYFKEKLAGANEKAKYNLASALFGCISYLINNKYSIQEFVITNLCNNFLPPTINKKTVLIPEKFAFEGLEEIRKILKNLEIEIIFAMSLQVNYWLQKLGFYFSIDEFLKGAEPQKSGINSRPPYYQPKDSSVFKLICGKEYIAGDKFRLFPILHIKNWPLKGRFQETYQDCYNELIKNFCEN